MCARYKADEPETPQGTLPPRRRPRLVPEQDPVYPSYMEEPAPQEDEPLYEQQSSLPPQVEPPPAKPKRRSYWEVPDDEPAPDHSRTGAAAAHNPWADVAKPPPKGISFWKGVWYIFGLPFRMAFFLTRNLPALVMWPLRLLAAMLIVGSFLFVVLAGLYTVKGGRYDITQVLRMPERSIVLDRTGLEIGTLHGENRRSINSLDEVPQYFLDAIVLQEDRSFWEHGGVDPRGVLRAVGQVFKHGRATQGGSTITMQLAKNTYNHADRNFDAKLTEVVLARRIEATYDKKTILTCYINRVFWGHTYLGLKQAAYGYFSKDPSELTIGECAMLAGIVCNPNEFSPLRNPSAAKVQRDKVLVLMRDFGKITHTQYEIARNEPIITRRPEPRGYDNYSLDLIRAEVDHILTLLDANGQRVKEDALYSGGLIVRTTLDLNLQDDVMRDMDARLAANLEALKHYKHQTRLQPGEIPGAKKWSPRNADGRYNGLKPASWGLLKSRNTMSVRVGARAGLQNVVNTALRSGFSDPPKWLGPTIYLGTWEASPLEVATSFTTYANGGVRPTPYIIESITDSEGRVIWQNQPSATNVFSRRASNATSEILQKITKKGGTAANVVNLGFDKPCGGKTGTTNAYKNAWFCGFTSEITAAVWVGFDRPVTIADKAYGGTVALPLWVGAMQCAEKRGYKMADIRITPTAGRNMGIRLCRVSGSLAHAGCEAKRTAYTDTMVDFTVPRPLCAHHSANDALVDDDIAEIVEGPNGAPADGFAEEPEHAPLFTNDDFAEIVE